MHIKSWIKMIGDVLSVDGNQVVVQTVNVATDGRRFLDDHPVLVADEAALKKIKVGKKLGFTGIIRRIGDRTKLILDPKHYSTNQAQLKDRYLNSAGVKGLVVFKQFFGTDPNKRAMLTIGIGEPNATGTALYGSIWRDMASHWNTLLTGYEAVVQLVGYMRSREMTGARAGDTMYELIANRELSSIVERRQISSGFENFDESNAEALMALEFDIPAEASNPTGAESGLSDHTDPNSAGDNIPF
jgi:hypothetical protein